MSSRDELEKLTATKLREVARQYEQITGATAMKKEDLIIAILKARGEPVDETTKDADAVARLKKQIRAVLKQRDSALAEKDRKKIAAVRTQLKKLKRQTRIFAGNKKKNK